MINTLIQGVMGLAVIIWLVYMANQAIKYDDRNIEEYRRKRIENERLSEFNDRYKK